MAKTLQLRRGTTTQHDSFTGLEGELTVDTDKDTVVVHDGSTAGGFPIEKIPTITSITYPTESGQLATALEATGSTNVVENLLINGTSFTSTVTVEILVGGTWSAFSASTSVNSARTIITCTTVTKRAAADGYSLRVTNSTNVQVSTTVNFSADPAFTTAAALPGLVTGDTLDQDIVVSGDGTLTWTEGSPAMPAWMTHFADGDTGLTKTLAGTAANTGATETFSFNIIVRDSQNQSHNRTFTLSVSDGATSTNSGGVGMLTTYTGYRVHTWTTVGVHTDSITFGDAMNVDVLVVGGGAGGGGGGGYDAGGGGGAGAMIVSATFAVAAGSYTVTVGDGGTGGTGGSDGTHGSSGGDSIFSTLTANGGGGGGPGKGTRTTPWDWLGHANGNASGGGGGGGCIVPGYWCPTGGAGGAYGNDGGDGAWANNGGCGGGGAGGAGGDTSEAWGGVSGLALANVYFDSTSDMYALGGYGGHQNDVSGTDAVGPNTGNGGMGGGGSSATPVSGPGGDGASGIVIIRTSV